VFPGSDIAGVVSYGDTLPLDLREGVSGGVFDRGPKVVILEYAPLICPNLWTLLHKLKGNEPSHRSFPCRSAVGLIIVTDCSPLVIASAPVRVRR